jgi:DNA-binding transcriptional ArsR family regulator
MPDWNFLTNHAIVLSIIAKHANITGPQLSSGIGIGERSVRRIIADLYSAGYIRKKRAGRGVIYSINPRLSLRHPTHQEIAIGDFLKCLGWRSTRSGHSG